MYCIPRQTKDWIPRIVVHLWWVGRLLSMTGWRAKQYGKRSLMWSLLLWSDREKVSYAVVYSESLIPWINCFELDVFNVLACFDLAAFLWSEGEGFGGFLMVCLLPVYSLFWLVILMQCWNVLLRSQIVLQLHWRFSSNGWRTLAPCSRCSDIGPVQLQNESWSARTACLPPNVEDFVNRIACAKRSRRWKAF